MRPLRRPAESLRRAIDCLPRETRRAMLDGLREEKIIAGAYVTAGGGVCPMLAAHRRGGRTSLASFARAWDRYTRAIGARRATARELRALQAMLEASLTADDPDAKDLAAVIAEHQRALRGRFEREAWQAAGGEAPAGDRLGWRAPSRGTEPRAPVPA